MVRNLRPHAERSDLIQGGGGHNAVEASPGLGKEVGPSPGILQLLSSYSFAIRTCFSVCLEPQRVATLISFNTHRSWIVHFVFLRSI